MSHLCDIFNIIKRSFSWFAEVKVMRLFALSNCLSKLIAAVKLAASFTAFHQKVSKMYANSGVHQEGF
jgi:hypothetical protein